MKYLFLICLSFAIFCSCSKTGSNPSPPAAKDSICHVTSIIYADGFSPSDTTFFSYDGHGKIIECKFDTTDAIYTYSDSRIFVSYPPYADTIQLNSHGLVTGWFESVKDAGAVVATKSWSYTYTDDTVLRTAHYQESSGLSVDETYIFSNGELLSVTDGGGITTSYSYYEDKPLIGEDVESTQQLGLYGALTYKNKHLIKSINYGNYANQISDYTYTMDARGRILTETITRFNNAATWTFSYGCQL